MYKKTHSHHRVGVAQPAESSQEGQRGDQNQNQVHLNGHHQGELQHLWWDRNHNRSNKDDGIQPKPVSNTDLCWTIFLLYLLRVFFSFHSHRLCSNWCWNDGIYFLGLIPVNSRHVFISDVCRLYTHVDVRHYWGIS